jgi:hypothetical protein
MSPSNFAWIAALSRFWEFWITNTIKKVMTLVTVLAMSCHASERMRSPSELAAAVDNSGSYGER